MTLREAAWRRQNSDIDSTDLPDRDYQHGYVLPQKPRRRLTNTEIVGSVVIVVAVIELIWFR